MLNIDKVRKILKESNIYREENDKNFLCKCIYCKDHRDPKKAHHLSVSKNENVPVAHCWLCGVGVPITKLLFDLTGKNDSTIVKIEKYIKKSVKVVNTRHKVYKIPELDLNSFPSKRNYMINRTFGKLDVKAIPNLIFDLQEFFALNNIDVALTKWEMTL